MLIDQFTGVIERRGLMIQKPVSHILIVASGTGAANVLNAEIAAFVTQGAKTTTITPGAKIGHLAGAIGRADGLGMYIDNDSKYHLLVCLAQSGGIPAVGGGYGKLDFSGLTATASYSIYGIESDNANGRLLSYVNLELQSDQQKFGNEGYEYLVLPKTNLKLAKLYFPNDGTPEFAPAEMTAHDMIFNELAAINEATTATTKQATQNLLDITVFDVSGARSFEIQRTPGQTYKFIAVDWK